jgi:dipeptidyl aminopeptidase/acylaminoacyl peptidase
LIKSILAIAAAALVNSAAVAEPAQKPDLSIYGALPSIEDVQISPDGSKLAIITTTGEQRFLTVRKTDGAMIAGVALGPTKLRKVTWAGDEHVILIVSQHARGIGVAGPTREYFMASTFNVVTGRQRPLLDDLKDTMNVIVGPPQVRTIDGETVLFLEGIHFVQNQGVNTLYRVNLRTGVTRMLDHGVRYDTDGWLVDASGEPVAQSMYDGKNGQWSLLLKSGSTWKTVDQANTPMGSYGLSGFGRDGKSVLVWRSDEQKQGVLREYRLSGENTDLPEDLELEGLLHDPDTLSLIGGYALKGETLSYTFFDPAAQGTWNAVARPFKNDQISLRSWSRDRKRVVVLADSPTDGPGYVLIDLNTKRGGFIGDLYKGVNANTISPVRPIKYKAADGLEITGYLTLPKGRDPKSLPLIVLPHGGPEGRDTPGFDWWSQALASRGYAVLQPNFRGSEGFGWDFVKAGFGEWGKKMQTDLSDGVRDLAKQGIVDPKRVCVVGASYGGYAALAGATLDQGVYRCAVSVAGPSDLKRMLISVRDAHNGNMSAAQRYWLRFMGADGIKDPDLAAISPARLADKVEIPVLLIHGKDDTVVRYDQSQIMADALKKAGKPVAFVTLDGEDHWLSRGATRLKMLTETVAFLEKHNPPE